MKLAMMILAACVASASFADNLSPEEFRSPPPSARPHTWWHWMNGNVTKDGITADLEAMASAGIGGAQIFDAGLALPRGPVAFASDEWFDCLVHADREAKRLGIDLCLANCSGWTSSGGPWITPALSMKHVTNTTVRVKGGERFSGVLPLPRKTRGFYEDIAVIAFPAPAKDASWRDFSLQVFRTRGSTRMGVHEMGPQMPLPLTDKDFPPEACVAKEDIIDLTSNLGADGSFTWVAPSSHPEWIVLRIGYVASGHTNRSASKEGFGLECDKLDPHALDVHFDAYVGKLLKLLPADRAFKSVLLDSYEVFGQNWTRGFEREFAARAGYPITPYLPVLAAYPVGSAAETERFLADFRRVISSLFCENYAGRLRERCRENGLAFWCEPYGNGPFNDLEYAMECDVPMAEFWRPRDFDVDLAALERDGGRYMRCRWGNKALGNVKTIAATAHVWGKSLVAAEAFTSYPDKASGRWAESPFAMKLQCDRTFAEGLNMVVFHRFVHQPWTKPARYPGMTMAAYGAHIDRTQTWWNHGAREFFAYMARAQHLLRKGTFVADVLLCTPGEAPEYGTDGEIPDGYDGDRCHPSVLAELKVIDGHVVVPGGVRYKVVGVPESFLQTQNKKIETQLARLKAAGARISTYGMVEATLREIGCAPDFICEDRDVKWIHRRTEDADVYFVAVPCKDRKRVRCSFRVNGKVPELWDPVTGETCALGKSRFNATASGRTELTLDCDPSHSVFVVFRSGVKTATEEPPRSAECAPIPVTGPWQVSFREPGAMQDVASIDLDELDSWTENGNPDIKYFSGTATYATALKVKARSAASAVLDLGRVKEIAEVTVNGKSYPALWKPPFRLDITDAIDRTNGGDATLDIEIKVTNLWPNRLIGDARLPDDCRWDNGSRSKGYPLVKEFPDWLLRGEKSPTGRHAFSICRFWNGDEPLLESGLLGPVSIHFASRQAPPAGDIACH